MQIKKIGAIVISLLLGTSCLFAGACGKENETSNKGNKVSYQYVDYDKEKDNLKSMIGAYWCPVAVEEYYQSIADCGINMIFLDQKLGEPNSQSYLSAMEYCDKYGIDAFVGRSDIRPYSKEEADKLADTYLNNGVDYNDYSSFSGINFMDEPSYNQLKYIEHTVELVKGKYPEAVYYTNLFPPYSAFDYEADVTYQEYLTYASEHIISKLDRKILSLDYYPLLHNNKMRGNWLWTVELATKMAKQYGFETMFFLQSVYQGELATELRQVNYDTLALQFYAYLSYGCNNFAHFLYYIDGENNQTFIDSYGQKTQQWYYAEKINKEILEFDHVMKQFSFNKAMAVYGKDNMFKDNDNLNLLEEVTQLDGIEKVNSNVDILISNFKDSVNNNGYMLFNFNDKDCEEFDGALSFNGEIDFYDYSGATLYYHGKKITLNKGDKKVMADNFPAEFSFKNGKLKVEKLEAGQGVFVIPFC